MVGIQMARLKYFSVDILLRYFDHSNWIHVWAWIHIAKTMWKQPNFNMDYALYRCHMVGVQMAHLKYLSLDIFLRYFDHSNRIHVWAWIHIAKTSWKLANFHMDFACYWLCMLDILMAHLNYLSLDIFLIYFGHSSRIPCVSMHPFSFVLAQANF